MRRLLQTSRLFGERLCERPDHAVGVNSGTDALILALKFLGIGPGDEVITQGNTFVATCLGASNNGARVVLCEHLVAAINQVRRLVVGT